MDQKNKAEIKIPDMLAPCFEGIVGMNAIKQTILNIFNMQQVNRRRFTLGVAGAENPYKNNLLITGPSGIGKTTAAGVVADCYKMLGIVSDSRLVTCDYQSLLSSSAAEISEKINKITESARDRIILIDNIEEFDDDPSYSPGFEMIKQITDAYYASKGSITIIATGEENAVRDFLRRKHNFEALFDIPMVVLDEYDDEDLISVAHRIALEMGYIIDSEADKKLLREYHYDDGNASFNHLKKFNSMILEASMNAASRVANIRHASDKDVSLLKAEDFRFSGDDGMEEKSLEELLAELNGLIGLTGVKEQVNSMIASVKIAKREAEAGISNPNGTLHMVFSGSPGTGKTTVARIIGKIYAKLGVLSKGQFVECSRSDLVADIVGGTAKQTHAMVERARGGVLFIDEAYSVCRDKYDTFGMEAVNTLTADIYNYRDDLLVILAGYEREMEDFLSQNPGMKSRVPHTIFFEDYTTDELMLIFNKYVGDRGMLIYPEAIDAARFMIAEKAMDPDFGNARGVENFFDSVIKNHQKRLAGMEFITDNDITIIRREDLESDSASGKKHRSLEECYEELGALTGLYGVKEKIRQMAARFTVDKIRRERGIPSQGVSSLHLVFKGNAGTGKTTVARLLGDIYHELGVLSTGKLVECTRSDIVGRFQGHTAANMKAKIREAFGGILFIDEVYSLCNGPYDNFGMEAINELVPAMENYRDNLMVIVAGYTEQMDDFLNSNQGLKSRFSAELVFEDFTVDELMGIFKEMLRTSNLVLFDEKEADRILRSLLTKCSEKKDFGNARGVRNLIESLMRIQECRLANMLEKGDDISDEAIQRIERSDLEELIHTS